MVAIPDIAPLHKCPEALNAVYRDFAVHVLAYLVIYPVMMEAELRQPLVSGFTICVNIGT